MFKFSTLFRAADIADAFDSRVHALAATGRVDTAFLQLIESAYGAVFPAGTRAFMLEVNAVLAADTCPTFASGPGARATNVQVVQALRALAVSLAASPAKNLPAVASLPEWADEAALAAKREAANEKRKATIAAKAAANPAPAEALAPALAASEATAAAIEAGAQAADILQDAINRTLAGIKGGMLTQVQLDALRAALEGAQCAPTAAKGKAKRVTAKAQDAQKASEYAATLRARYNLGADAQKAVEIAAALPI